MARVRCWRFREETRGEGRFLRTFPGTADPSAPETGEGHKPPKASSTDEPGQMQEERVQHFWGRAPLNLTPEPGQESALLLKGVVWGRRDLGGSPGPKR